MMDTYDSTEIQELPLRVPFYRRKVEDFLGRNGLRLEEVDLYLGILDAEGSLLDGGGLYRDIIKCIAVSEAARSEGYSVPLISRLIAIAAERGYTNVKVFTKPGNRTVFESLGFRLLSSAPKAILMENGRGLEEYCRSLQAHGAGTRGVIVMNANPFTLGHRYLIETASKQVDRLFVLLIEDDLGIFSYAERFAMAVEGTRDLQNVKIAPGGPFQATRNVFQEYFVKVRPTDMRESAMVDTLIFAEIIAKRLGFTRRFLGDERHNPKM